MNQPKLAQVEKSGQEQETQPHLQPCGAATVPYDMGL